MAWHPSQKNLLLSGSTDGLISIFDTDQADEEDAVQQVLNPRSAVHCSGFLADDQAYVLSTDEQFTIYGLNKTGTADDAALPVAEFGDVRPQLDCMYVVRLVQNQSQPTMLAHGHNAKQKLQLTTLKSPQYSFEGTIDLPGAHGEEVVRDVRFAHQTAVLTCGEDGHVRLWRIDSVNEDSTRMDIDEAPKSTKKKSRKEKKQADRFAPY
ncbi:hypothetical protein AMS68_003124 [Peltaster fructicola]|uniref:Uncharacterized protein n=1 Tax=Peltaster fructicola TaxID=286661 RepID=A0A6H0XS71_9PEZI|nr:hypothetical protein AMS68_003124 [Peltaster fructicola]